MPSGNLLINRILKHCIKNCVFNFLEKFKNCFFQDEISIFLSVTSVLMEHVSKTLYIGLEYWLLVMNVFNVACSSTFWVFYVWYEFRVLFLWLRHSGDMLSAVAFWVSATVLCYPDWLYMNWKSYIACEWLWVVETFRSKCSKFLF